MSSNRQADAGHVYSFQCREPPLPWGREQNYSYIFIRSFSGSYKGRSEARAGMRLPATSIS